MKIRALATYFFLLYGISIPVFARDFTGENSVATIAIVLSCFLISALLWTGRALLFNILLAFYLLRVYFTRPYVDMFLPNLQVDQLDYIASNNYFFNPADAAVVYLSLLSLLLAWFCGLHFVQPNKLTVASPPWIFRQVDKIVFDSRWSFWLVWLMLSVLNFRSPVDSWQTIATGEGGSVNFAFGLLTTSTINFVCLYTFILKGQSSFKKSSLILLVPVLIATLLGIVGGARSALFGPVIMAIYYWTLLNYHKYFNYRDLFRLAFLAPLSAIIILSGLLAQQLRPLLRSGADFSTIWTTFLSLIDFSVPGSPTIETFYFGMTELLHRLSSLKAAFLILNDHFIHDPWVTFNPIGSIMRIINDLVPGDPFANMLTINQLFDYIYHNNLLVYNSETWGIQGTLYLYFGYLFSPFVIFIVACMVGRHYRKLDAVVKISPSFAVFVISLFTQFVEFGTFERVIPVDIVRPLSSFLMLIFLSKLLRLLAPVKRTSHFS